MSTLLLNRRSSCRRDKLDRRHCWERPTSFARKILRATYLATTGNCSSVLQIENKIASDHQVPFGSRYAGGTVKAMPAEVE